MESNGGEVLGSFEMFLKYHLLLHKEMVLNNNYDAVNREEKYLILFTFNYTRSKL